MNFMNTIDHVAVLAWYSGKSATNMAAALDALERSLAQGYWEEGWSRKLPAAATKANVASKFARTVKRDAVFEGRPAYGTPGYQPVNDAAWAVLTMNHGHVRARDLAKIDAAAEAYLNETQLKALNCARAFHADLAPVWAAIERLDATRPKPVFTSIGASPTITKTLAELGVVANGSGVGISVCPMRFEEIETVDKDGKKTYRTVCFLEWPAGTEHHTSRFSIRNLENWHLCQCESCGHAIKNGHNWVPLVATVPGQTPRSLWVGRDCAKTLFGVDVKGEVEIDGLKTKA